MDYHEPAAKQLLELLLAYPKLVATVKFRVVVGRMPSTAMRRLLAELYASHEADETVTDMIVNRLRDSRGLQDAAIRMQRVGLSVDRPELWLDRIISALEIDTTRLARLRAQLATCSEDEASGILREMQEVSNGRAAA